MYSGLSTRRFSLRFITRHSQPRASSSLRSPTRLIDQLSTGGCQLPISRMRFTGVSSKNLNLRAEKQRFCVQLHYHLHRTFMVILLKSKMVGEKSSRLFRENRNNRYPEDLQNQPLTRFINIWVGREESPIETLHSRYPECGSDTARA
jgi:hypothetical protein